MKEHMTIQDIADAVGVSKTTVSRYLNGKYNYMSKETRQRIERAIKAADFRPNKSAGSLKSSRSDLIGLVIPDASAMLTPLLISSIIDECTAWGRKAIVVSTHDDPDKERRLVRELAAHQVDGIITATGGSLPLYQEISAAGIRVIHTDRLPAGSPLDGVAVDHYTSCAAATGYMIDQGCRRIVFLLRQSKGGYGTFAPREEGVREVCAARSGEGVAFERILVSDGEIGDFHRFRRRMRQVCGQEDDRPTAVFVAEGLLMSHVICAVNQLRLSLSDRFTIYGYDDTRVAAASMGSILTLNQPLQQMGAMAARILVGRIEGTVVSQERIHCFLDCAIAYPIVSQTPLPLGSGR